jgi:hypothetical protein
MKAPSIFKPFDLLSFVLPIVVCAGCTGAAWLSDVGLQAQLLMTTVTLAFIGVTLRVLQARQKFIKSYSLEIAYNVRVKLNGYSASWSSLAHELHRIIDAYEVAYPNVRQLLQREPTWVEFTPDLLKAIGGRQVAGYVIGDMVKVSYAVAAGRGSYATNPNAHVARTAFAHEIAHVIIGRATGRWNNEEHHMLMEKVNP